MRIVLEIGKNADPELMLRELYKRTPMQTTFSINLLALVMATAHAHSEAGTARLYRAQADGINDVLNMIWKSQGPRHILEGYLIA